MSSEPCKHERAPQSDVDAFGVLGDAGSRFEPGEADPAWRQWARDEIRRLRGEIAHTRRDTLLDAADDLSAATEGPNRDGTTGWSERHRDIYSLAIEEASDALRCMADLEAAS